MAGDGVCPKCEVELPGDAPQGLCPACLIGFGLADEPTGTASRVEPEDIDAQPSPGSVDVRTTVADPRPAASPRDAAAETGPPAGADGLPDRVGPPESERVGKYQVIRPLGRGGQARTYLALDPDLGRHVVLKLYHEARTPDQQEWVLKEGRALARVQSRYLAQCYSAEREGDRVYLVMEYVPGRTLTGSGRERRPGFKEAVRRVEHVAEGLAAVHACGLLHRDIKPANIVVGDDEVPRLVDFGLAAHLGSAALEDLSGTPCFMAPEQARRQWERIDPRTDVYGLGGVLYALLTGQPPHPGVTPDEQLAHARRGDVIPPRALQPSIPRALQGIVLAALAADPARRYASAAELRQALRRYRHRPMYAAAVAGLVALLVVVAQALAWPRPWSSPPAPPVAPPPPQAPLWVERMELEHSRDGGTTILGTIGVSDTSACRSEDAVRIKARLTAPAYCYLIALHPNGSTELYHPGDEAVPPPLSNRLSYPLDNHLSPLTDGVGLQAFVLVASREPLPPYAQWKARLGDLPWGATQAEGVWHYDGQQFEPRSRRRSEPRPAAVVVPAPFEAACRALRQVPGIEAIDAWAFPILPKESASPDPAPDQTPGGP